MADDSNLGALAIVGVIAFSMGRCSVGDPEPAAVDFAASASYGDTEVQGLADFSDAEPATTFAPPIDVEPAPEPEPFVAPAPSPVRSVYYQNCSAARAAGAAPVRVGDPGYAPHLDRDRDGVGCE